MPAPQPMFDQQQQQQQSLHSSSDSKSSDMKDRQTVIVFDWDDTLLCSTFLSSKGLRLDTPSSRIDELNLRPILQSLEQSIIHVLTLAMSHGQVIIITNAETGWIQLAAQKFIPSVAQFLHRNESKIPLISARSSYEKRHPDSPLKWKFYAFQDNLQPYLAMKGISKNILSFGDSHVEREAVRAVTRGHNDTRCKSVKFAERPSLEQLKRQQELVSNCFTYIFQHDGDLDLQLTVTINNNQTNQSNKQSSNNQKVIQQQQSTNVQEQTEEKPESI